MANPDVATAIEDQPLVVDAAHGLLANDTDVDRNALSVTTFSVGGNSYAAGSTATLAGVGTLLINADGSYTFTPNLYYNGPVPVVSYTATDGTLTSTSTLTLGITPVNHAPVANPDVATAIEDQPLVVDAAHGLLANDTDVDRNALSVTTFSVGGNSYAAGSTATLAGVGTLLINADGSYTFTPNLYYNGPVPVVSYTATDGTLTSTSTLTLDITPVNHAPTISLDDNQSHNVVSVQPISGLFNTGEGNNGIALATNVGITDPHYTLVSAPSGASASNAAIQLNYAWLQGDAHSTWIGSTGNEPTGTYVYQTSFTLQPGADPRSVLIGFDLASDNNLRDILVNGVSTGISSNVQYSSFVHFDLNGINAAFQSGANTISFVVDNRDTVTSTSAGPTGLLIDNMTGSVAVIDSSTTTHVGDYATVYVEGTPVSISDVDTHIADVDGPLLQSATITLTNAQAGDVLLASGLPAGITASFDSTGTVLTLSGAASQATYEQAIHTVQFNNTTDNPATAVDRLITVVVSDGQLDSNLVTTTVHVVPVDAAPVLDLDATAPGTGYAATYHDTGAAIAVVGINDLVTDSDSAQMRSATVHISNVQAGDLLTVGSLPAGISAATYDSNTGLLNLSGAASLADYQAALRSVVFSNTGNNPSVVTRSIEITVNDSTANSNVAISQISVVADNHAPVAVPDTATITEDLAFTSAAPGVLANDTDVDNGDTKSVSGVAFGATQGALGSPLAGTYGTLTLNADGSYTYLANKAPAEALGAGQTANEQFTYTMKDAAGATSSTTLTFTITGTNDAPVNQAPNNQTTAEDTALVFSTANGNAITVSDVDTPNLTVTLSSTNGALTLGSTAGVTVGGNGTGTVTLSGSSAAINAALNGSSYKSVADYNGTAQLTVSTSDGSAPAVVSTIAVTITPVIDIHNDSATTFESQAVTINTNANDTFSNPGHAITAINGAAIGTGGSVAVANGSVTLQPDGTLLFTPTAGYNTGNGAPTSFSYTVSSGGVTETANVDVTVTPVNNAPTPTLSVTPVARWTFNENSGTATTDAYNARNATLSDSTPTPASVLPTWVTGHTGTAGSALQFDGAGSYVALDATATAPLLTTSTLSFWIKTTQVGTANGWNSPAVVASEQAGGTNDIQWGTLNAKGQIGFDVGNATGLYSTTAINDNTWHQVAITRDASTKLVKVYVDGLLEASGSPTDAGFTGTLNRLAGFGATNVFSNNAAGTDLPDSNFLKASLDDVRIYDHVLTSDQVAAIKSVEAGYHNLAVANDGDATRLNLAASNYTDLSVSGLNSGMVITDGTAAHTVTSTGTDAVVDMTGWNTGSVSISGSGTGSATLIFNATDTVNGESHSATQYLNLVNGTTLLSGGAGNDTLNATTGASLLVGNDGNDTLNGGAGNDRLIGGAGNDTLNGGAGNDIIYGGQGNDTLNGGAGADVFAWKLADRGSAGTPATDQVTDFNLTSAGSGGDSIDLRDLLVGANHVGANAGNLSNYLDFDTTSTPGSTIIHVSSTGGFSGGTYSASAEDQRIVLQGVNVRSAGTFGLSSAATDNDVIHQLLQRGKLVTDGP